MGPSPIAFLLLALLELTYGWSYLPHSLTEGAAMPVDIHMADVAPRCGPWMCQWDPWGEWSECRSIHPRVCIIGRRQRSREAKKVQNCPDLRCIGNKLQTRMCKPNCSTVATSE